MTTAQLINETVKAKTRRDGGKLLRVRFIDRQGREGSEVLSPYDAWRLELDIRGNGWTHLGTDEA